MLIILYFDSVISQNYYITADNVQLRGAGWQDGRMHSLVTPLTLYLLINNRKYLSNYINESLGFQAKIVEMNMTSNYSEKEV